MANQPIPTLPPAISLDGTEQIEIVQPAGSGGTTKRATAQQIATTFLNNIPAAIEYVVDGGGSAITPGMKGYLIVPFAATITQASLYGDAVGSIVVDIWKCTFAQFDGGVTHPVVGDTITAGSPPTITASSKSSDTVLAGWTVALASGDVLAFNVNSATVITRVTLSLELARVL